MGAAVESLVAKSDGMKEDLEGVIDDFDVKQRSSMLKLQHAVNASWDSKFSDAGSECTKDTRGTTTFVQAADAESNDMMMACVSIGEYCFVKTIISHLFALILSLGPAALSMSPSRSLAFTFRLLSL